MKKWALMILSLLMMLALAAPAMAQTGELDAAQNAGTVSAPYTVEFTYDGNQYVMPGDSSVRLSAVLDEIGLTGEAEAVAVSDESLFSASNETGEWIVTAHQAFSTTEWMKVTINGVVYEITVTDDSANTVTYLDASGAQQSCTTYTTVESSSTSWNSGWCVVNSNTTISDRITVSGTVNLILTNNATLTASKGITVGSDATLNIYAQTDDEATMGALVADATNDNANWYAGIGGVENADAGTITINGGKINATGWCAAGIGSGGGTSTVGTITINGGIVTAHDNGNCGAGIGGGFSGGKAGTINLNGGVIHAAGIGSGYMGGDCSITVNISDGVKKIVATPVQGGACIGKGESANGTVTVNFISGGNIVTGADKDAVFYDTGEGSERQIRAKAMNHAVTMSDDLKANITATSEYAFTGETVTLTLGTAVDATTLSVNDGAVATTDAGNRQYTFTMPDEDVTVTATLLQTYAVNLPANMEVVSATNAADANGKYITGTTVTFKASFSYAASDVSDGTNTLTADDGVYSVAVADADITVTATVERSGMINLADAPGAFTALDSDVLTGTTNHTVTIANGANFTLNNATINGGIVCAGSAVIILVGTNSVSNSAYDKAGIQIGGSGTTLTIKGNGSLTATGGNQAAGIGLGRTWDDNATGGSIVIEGGAVTASGGNGIGTGRVGNSKTATIGDIVIKGGTVNARLGKGEIVGVATANIGAIKIYDTIEKVDASKITESVTYMHVDGNTETDVTASASTYFTIIEDGDRRIIEKKDNTDYTITIADNSENGTIACAAATAKYGEKITITATPDFGYRLSRLVVKDAQNNDVASTGNSFFMPKSNVTVSAVFEQGVHGTTEFAWGYSEPNAFVTEATIYDGVTTVELQQRKSYRIYKYNNEYSYRIFHLDNDVYDASIPYTGGTGVFSEYGNATDFSVPYDGETGYYDITMTDTGNGKWNVSILKTAGQMDVVPDQTYTGSEIKPEPLVLAGSLSLTKGTDYVYSYTNNKDAGTATVRATFQGDYASLGYVEKQFTIAHHHSYSFASSVEGATITATCTADGCTLPPSSEGGTDHVATLTIGAPTLTYVGQTGQNISAVATLTDLNNIQGDATVSYYKANADGTAKDGQELGSAPTSAGKYWAEITLGTGENIATAHVVYSIGYTVTFNTNGGTPAPQMQVVAPGETATRPDPDPTQQGKIFGGWFADADFAKRYVFDEVTENTTVYAKWGEHRVTWTVGKFSIQDVFTGNAPAADSNETVNLVTNMNKPEGATFEGWKTETDVSGDVTHTAQFSFPVTLNVNGGTINAGNVESYIYGTGATLPTDVTRAKYDFGGWFDNSGLTGTAVTQIGTTATGSKEYWAKWTEVYAVAATVTANNRTFDGTEKPLVTVTGEPTGGKMIYAIGTDASTAPTDTAYGEKIPTGTNISTYYVWYKVVGDANHNDSTSAYVEVRIANATVTLTYDANGGFGAPDAETGRSDRLMISQTIPTMYTGDTFRVTLDYNDGSGSKSIFSTLHRYYYTFTGWNTARDGSGTSYQPGAAYTGFDSVTLYAQWRAGGEASAPVQLPTPERDGYDFVGWGKNAEAETGVVGRYVPISDVTLYAVWTLRQYTLTFDTDGGSEIAPVTGVSGTEIPAPADPEKFGFIFAGWDREIPATMPNEDITIKALWKPTQFGTADYTLPDALTEIEEEAFAGAAVMAVYVPDTVEVIGANAFKDCELLWKIRLPQDCEIDETAFSGCTAFLVYAPAGGTVEKFCAEQESIIFVPEIAE